MPKKLKQGWTRVAFGDVVRLCRERSADPAEDGFDRYVGLEHLDPGDLKIRRWGNTAAGTTFTNVFRAGHVLFGKRRAYQKKVAVADFDGVCSGDIYVLESADPKRLLPELLPFICQTDRFFEHAVGTSAGSLSPRTNWNSLADYEFALPPLEEQRRIAELLWACTEANDTLYRAASAADAAFKATLRGMMANSAWPLVPLGEVARVDRGKFSHRPRNLPQFFGGPYPFVQTGDVAAARGRLLQPSQTLSEEGVQYSKSFPEGSILVTIAAVIGATAITTKETWCTDSVVGIVPVDQHGVDFIEYALRHLRPYLEHEVATQTAQKNINLDILRPLLIPWPKRETREYVVGKLAGIEAVMLSTLGRTRQTRDIAQSVTDQFIGGVA